MRILIIEDNLLKREKVVSFLNSAYDVELVEAASYNSGLVAAENGVYDFMIIDMSMPTFDRSETTQGGRFRAIAGKEIASKLSKAGKLAPFVVLTGYKDFSVNSQNLSIEQIHDLLSTLGEQYKGCIIFNSAEILWQEQLASVIGAI
ncbi:Response regulator receiver domain-containing protein [Pseudomonas salomonii]|uniref:Response regulator receiver domain-containing protein n=1 Tax=Pseudomonas salomonii TaxID=191391 RepID=A0A1H3C102_9PSED|nr:Response regulator receiver domain-containing protein [Pseudomonas salomonii]